MNREQTVNRSPRRQQLQTRAPKQKSAVADSRRLHVGTLLQQTPLRHSAAPQRPVQPPTTAWTRLRWKFTPTQVSKIALGSHSSECVPPPTFRPISTALHSIFHTSNTAYLRFVLFSIDCKCFAAGRIPQPAQPAVCFRSRQKSGAEFAPLPRRFRALFKRIFVRLPLFRTDYIPFSMVYRKKFATTPAKHRKMELRGATSSFRICVGVWHRIIPSIRIPTACSVCVCLVLCLTHIAPTHAHTRTLNRCSMCRHNYCEEFSSTGRVPHAVVVCVQGPLSPPPPSSSAPHHCTPWTR